MNNVDVDHDRLFFKDEYGATFRVAPCLVHRSYRGKGKPTSDCHYCKELYALRQSQKG